MVPVAVVAVPWLPLLPFPWLPLFPLFPLSFPLPFAPFPFPLLVAEPVTVATVATLEAEAVLALLAAILPDVLWLLPVVTAVVPELDELQIVSLFAALRDVPDAVELSRARPCVTLWKLRRTSPIEEAMRVTPGLAEAVPAVRFLHPFAALRGADGPALGTGTRAERRRAGLALFDRVERARSAERETWLCPARRSSRAGPA